MVKRFFGCAIVAALFLSACSSRPREFVAALETPPADMAKYQHDQEVCRTMVAEGQRSGFGARLASGSVGTAAGVGAAALAVGGGTYAGFGAAAAAAGTAMTVMPVIGIAAAWGVAKAQKGKKERELKEAMALCLTESGYSVAGWKVARGAEKAQMRAAVKSAKTKKAKASSGN